MEYDKSVLNRLKRIEGQIKGVLGMMEQGKDCREIITQLAAARNAIDRTMGVVPTLNNVFGKTSKKVKALNILSRKPLSY